MTIEQLGSIGELIGAVATVATLAYLAIQIRANTRISALESRRAVLESGIAMATVVVDNGEVAEIFNRGLVDINSLNDSESTRFTFLVSSNIASVELAFEQHELGFDIADSLEKHANNVYFLRSPGGREWWRKNKRQFTPAFTSWLDHELDLDG